MKREIQKFACVVFAATICVFTWAQTPGGVSSGLQIWLKADAGTSTTTNGATLATWQDQSGNGRDATMPTSNRQPYYYTNIVNGMPGIYTNGGSRYLNVDLSTIANGEFTVFAVTQRANTNIFNYFIGIFPGVSTNSNMALGYRQSSQANLTLPTGNNRLTIPVYAGSAEPAVSMLAEYSSSAARTLTLTNNGVNYALSGSGGTITAQSGVGQIGRGSNTSGFTGYINEIIIWWSSQR
jgi:hypothetical protein